MGFVGGATAALRIPRSKFSNLGENNARCFLGLPILGLRLPDEEVKDKMPLVTLAHELIHVLQREARPVHSIDRRVMEDRKVRDELEALHVAGIYGLALYFDGGPNYEGKEELRAQGYIDMLRKENADASDPFAPTPGLLQALKDNGFEDFYSMESTVLSNG